MRSPTLRMLAVAFALAALALFALVSCFQPPQIGGPYRCDPAQACPSPYTCDDGICCLPDAGGTAYECPSYVAPNGRCSDGGTPRTYFQDLDQDGYGANGTGRLLCRDPGGYPFAFDAGDCDDSVATGAAIHPGVPDVCDGKDNNCNGQTDEPPACGGPRSVFIDQGMTVGAKKLQDNWFNGSPPRCLKDDPADPNAGPDSIGQFTGVWTGSRSTTHVFWAAAPPGTTWDLSGAGRAFHLVGTVSMMSANYPNDWIWYPESHPWIMICGPGGFLRLATPAGQSVFSLTYELTTGFDETFPVRGGNGWNIQPGSAADRDAVLRQVDHVEVLVEPYPASGGASFDIDFDEGQTGFQ